MAGRRARRPSRRGGGKGRPVLRDRGDPAGDLVSAAVGVQLGEGAVARAGPGRRRGRRRGAGRRLGGLGAPRAEHREGVWWGAWY